MVSKKITYLLAGVLALVVLIVLAKIIALLVFPAIILGCMFIIYLTVSKNQKWLSFLESIKRKK